MFSLSLTLEPQPSLIQPFLPLDPRLDTKLLGATQWAYGQIDGNSGSIFNGSLANYGGLAAAAFMPEAAATKNLKGGDDTDLSCLPVTGSPNRIQWDHHGLSEPITPSKIATSAAATDSSAVTKTTSASCSPDKNSEVGGVTSGRAGSRVQRPVSFSLPKRSCVLLHQSAAVFIQAGRGSAPSAKSEGLTAQERVRDLAEKVMEQRPSWSSGSSSGSSTGSTSGSTGSSNGSSSGSTGSSTTVKVDRRESHPIPVALCQGDVAADGCTGLRDCGSDSGTGAHLYLSGGTPQQMSCGIVGAATSKESEACGHAGIQRVNPTQPREDLLAAAANQPQCTNLSNENRESQTNLDSPPLSDPPRGPLAPLPGRPKEPFCPVLSRDGSRVLLWPSEMLSYTRTAPSVSYSINPLLYDFRAHNRTRDGGEGKRVGPQDGRERIKLPVIKQADSQPRREVATEGEMRDEKGREDKGGEEKGGVEVGGGGGGDAVPDDRDESALKSVSTESHQPTPGLQSTGERRKRRRKKRGGVRRGMRKRGKRRRGRREERTVISGSPESQVGSCGGRVRRREEVRGSEGVDEEEEEEKEEETQGDQTERETAGRNDEQLLSDLPLNRCNRCDQLCAPPNGEAGPSQFHQSGDRWGRRLRKLLCRGAACSSVISPAPAATQMPRCPAITAVLGEMEEIGGGEGEGELEGGEQRRNPSPAAIRAGHNSKGSMCDLAIGAAPHTGTARPSTISFAAAAFRAQRQTTPAEHCSAELDPARPYWPHPPTEAISEGECRKRKLPEEEADELQPKRRKRGRRHCQRAGQGRPGDQSEADSSQQQPGKLPENLDTMKTTGRASEATEHSKGEELPDIPVSDQETQPSDNRTGIRVEDSGMCSPTTADQTPDAAAAPDRSKDLIPSEVTSNNHIQHHDGPAGGANRITADHCGFSNRVAEAQSRAEPRNHEKETVRGEATGGIEQSSNAACRRIDPAGRSSGGSGGGGSSGNSSSGSGAAIDSGQRGSGGSNHSPDCNHCTNAVDWNAAGALTRKGGGGGGEGEAEDGRTWARRKERARRDADRFCPEKRPRLALPLGPAVPPPPPPHCIPLHGPLLLTPPLYHATPSSSCSSSSAAFSFHHTVVQHHLSLLPPPAHLPLHSYPHPFPAFPPHLPPLRLSPAPPPPPPPPPPPHSFYASPPIPLLDAAGPFPLAAAFHPLPTHPHPQARPHPHSHPPPLYPATHPAVLPLQMLF